MQLINTQQIEKPVKLLPNIEEHLQYLDINSIFYTIQGEGPFAGRTAVFVRLAGCNLQCPMCDTEYTDRVKLRPGEVAYRVGVLFFESTVRRVIAADAPTPKPLVVITGGEPLRQPIRNLVEHLLSCGYSVQIETNGTLYRDLPYSNQDLTVVCSPKTGSINHKLMPHIKALKYVASWQELNGSLDGLPSKALGHSNSGQLARPAQDWKGEIYLQPADHKDDNINKANLQAVVRSCMEHGHRLCLQMHKYADIE